MVSEDVLSKIVLRAGLIWEVCKGSFDKTVDLAAANVKLQERCDRLVDVVRSLEYDRAYFLALWKKAGREHAAAQGFLIEKIDELRQRLGEPEDKSFLNLLEDYSKRNVDTQHPFDTKQFPKAPTFPTGPVHVP